MESIEQTLDRLEKIYDAAVARLREDVIAFDQQGTAFADAMLDQPVRQGRTRRI